MLGLFVLQTLFDLTNEEGIEAFTFHETFRFTLDLDRDDCQAPRTWYYYYHARRLGAGEEVFANVRDHVAKLTNINEKIQRKDSTVDKTQLNYMTRLELFRSATEKFLPELKEKHLIIFGRFPQKTRDKFLPENESATWFAKARSSRYAHLQIEASNDIIS